MPEADLGVQIKTRYDGRGANRARKETKGLGSEIEKLAKQFAAGWGIVEISRRLKDLAIGTFEAGEQARVSTTAFTNLSGSANIAAVNLAAMDRATKGLISDTEQMQIANQLLGMDIVQTGDQLEDVVSKSRRLGKAFRGMGAREAADEFAIMIANMSRERLDSFGISSGNVKKRIDELMRTTEGMTREQAFFQATMEEADKTLERLGPEVETTSNQVAKLGAAWGNFQVFLGQTAEESGLVSDFFKSLAGDLTLIQNLLGDDSPEARIKALNVELAREGERLAMLEARGEGFFGVWAAGAGRAREHIAGLEAELAALEGEQQKVIAAGEKEQEQRQAAIAAEERAAENLAKREEAAKKFGEAQEEFSRDIIELQRRTDDQLSDLQEQFIEDREDAQEKHRENIADIREDAAKDAVKAAKRLQKDLAKVDKGLKKDLAKQQIDENKEIAKLQERAVKEERITRRRKQIDAAADERLFQFELRQLAAEGQGNAIKAALERREIEEQIASEKAEFEKRVESEKRDDQIDSIREEGRERRAQLRQQAAERRADLQARAEEEAEERAIRLDEEIADEGEAYQERREDLREFLDERQAEVEEGEQERVAEIARGLTTTEEMTNTQMDRMVTLAKEFGPEIGQSLADGMTEGFSENLRIDEALEKAGIGAGAGPLPTTTPTTNGAAQRSGMNVFQGGGIVERTGPAFLHRGEEVANPNQGQAIVIGGEQFAVREAGRLAAAINAQRQRDFQEYTDALAELLN